MQRRRVRRVLAGTTALCALVAVFASLGRVLPRPALHLADGVNAAEDGPNCPWLDPQRPVAQRVNDLIGAMTPLQEATMLHLLSDSPGHPYQGYTPAIPALCIPAITEQDGSAGVGDGWTTAFGPATRLPAPIADAAAWDPSLARQYGAVIGAQDASKGVDVALAPTLNIDRSPRWGRSYESLGEDPYLTATLGIQLTSGIQSNRVVAVIKHFAAYNQETHRGTRLDDAIVGDRALHEIYLPAFAAVVHQADPGGVMCSYNLLNGTPACQDLSLLQGTLRDEWGFAGFIRSDCGSVYQQASAIGAGVSQVKCSRLYNADQLAAAVRSRHLSRAALDALARPLLGVLFRFDLIADPHPATPAALVDATNGDQTALQVANEGAVLLRNQGGLLPLDLRHLGGLALIGANGASPMTAGYGAVYVRDPTPDTALAAFRAVLGRRVQYASGASIPAAAALARRESVVVVVVHDVEAEGRDRTSLSLPGNQNALISAVEAANPHTVVVLETGAAVTMPWLATTPALLETWYPGGEAGPSLVDLLGGQVDPSGKLPVSFPTSATAMPDATASTFGGVDGRTIYADGIDVGYRWYQTHGVQPAFTFGYGLAYTSFAFSRLRVTPGPGGATVSATVTNTGRRAGADVVQCYVGDPASTGEPPLQLRGFQRISLRPGESGRVTMTLSAGDLATWDTSGGQWVVAPGTYQIAVGDGSSPASLPLRGTLTETGANLGADAGPAPVPSQLTGPARPVHAVRGAGPAHRASSAQAVSAERPVNGVGPVRPAPTVHSTEPAASSSDLLVTPARRVDHVLQPAT